MPILTKSIKCGGEDSTELVFTLMDSAALGFNHFLRIFLQKQIVHVAVLSKCKSAGFKVAIVKVLACGKLVIKHNVVIHLPLINTHSYLFL